MDPIVGCAFIIKKKIIAQYFSKSILSRRHLLRQLQEWMVESDPNEVHSYFTHNRTYVFHFASKNGLTIAIIAEGVHTKLAQPKYMMWLFRKLYSAFCEIQHSSQWRTGVKIHSLRDSLQEALSTLVNQVNESIQLGAAPLPEEDLESEVVEDILFSVKGLSFGHYVEVKIPTHEEEEEAAASSSSSSSSSSSAAASPALPPPPASPMAGEQIKDSKDSLKKSQLFADESRADGEETADIKRPDYDDDDDDEDQDQDEAQSSKMSFRMLNPLNLITYREKYLVEKRDAEALREEAQELDEKHGGLGVYDDEVEMIANPLVVQMQELQKQLEQTNASLATQEELDLTQMAAMDKERQRILEEIKRVKQAIASQKATVYSIYDQPSSMPYDPEAERRRREEDERRWKQEQEERQKREEEEKKRREEEEKRKEERRKRKEEEKRRKAELWKKGCWAILKDWYQKKSKESIDQVFADMENVFNGLSAWIVGWEPRQAFKFWSLCERAWGYFWRIPRFFFLLLFIVAFSFIVMLPACFVLLILRTKTVERKVETGFAVRQEVLKLESKKKKSLRVMSLVFRALPMIFLILVWPILSVYYIIPHYHATEGAVGGTIGLYICVVIVLQCLGTVRSLKSFQLKKEAELEDKRLKESNSLVGKEAFQINFRWKNFGNLIGMLTLVVESVQLALFSMQKLAPGDDTSDESTSPSQGGVISETVIPRIFISLNAVLTTNIHIVYAWVGIVVTIVLILLFILQFTKELQVFGHFKADAATKKANKFFFHSFVGTIIYGHGELHDVNPKIAHLAALLSDTLFMIICEKLILVFSCEPHLGTWRLLIKPEVECWTGEHSLLATLCLISFGYYLPLSTMIAPMLVESENEIGKDGLPKKDLRFVKPFLSILTVSKCILLVVGTFFGRNDAVTTVFTSFVVFFILFCGVTNWALTPGQDDTEKYGLGEPCWPPFVNVWRCLAFAGGLLGAVCAIVAEMKPNIFAGDMKFMLLWPLLLLMYLLGIFWYFYWRRRVTVKEREFQRMHSSAPHLMKVATPPQVNPFQGMSNTDDLVHIMEGVWHLASHSR